MIDFTRPLEVPDCPVDGLWESEVEAHAERLGVRFFACSASTAAPLAADIDPMMRVLPSHIAERLKNCEQPEVVVTETGLLGCLIPLLTPDEETVAVGYALRSAGIIPDELQLRSIEAGLSADELKTWCESLSVVKPDMLLRFLRLSCHAEAERQERYAVEQEIETVTEEIQRNYEELNLLHSLTRNLTLSQPSQDLAQVAMARMKDCTECEGVAIWITSSNQGESEFHTLGDVPFDAFGLASLVGRFAGHDWSTPMVRNYLEGSLLSADFSDMHSLILAPIEQGDHRLGWVVGVNAPEGREFGSVEGSLVNSVATILGTHLRNVELYREHEELIVSFVLSMVSTLDAKDPYTRGHSDRVALVARRLAQHVGLPEKQINSIYISGLVHDIGKIGIDDGILRKPGDLTDEEFEVVKQHPMIGYEILKGMKNLQHVLPGVRSHHESWDGTGYPDQLKGTEIPLMARIMAVADAYDAMGSDRPYRKGMPMERIEGIFRKGSGQQWDPEIINAFFAVKDDVIRICEEYDPEAASSALQATLLVQKVEESEAVPTDGN